MASYADRYIGDFNVFGLMGCTYFVDNKQHTYSSELYR
jgi:hypothetical protein